MDDARPDPIEWTGTEPVWMAHVGGTYVTVVRAEEGGYEITVAGPAWCAHRRPTALPSTLDAAKRLGEALARAAAGVG